MINKISTTFGSEYILDQIIKNHPNRRLELFVPVKPNGNLQLLDLSNLESVFSSPISYKVLNHSGTDNWTSFINYLEINADDNEAKIINAKLNGFINSSTPPTGMDSIYYLKKNNGSNTITVLTTWMDESYFNDWYKKYQQQNNSYLPLIRDFSTNYYSASFINIKKW
ncbi:hypothetical protein R4B61_04275 [Fructilactobacillus vespulae]|uniref:hypothetical protein n=1 Tax=Fructilactobacillus vespulae TaxID=1249630 RepID=UPI0039B5A7C9